MTTSAARQDDAPATITNFTFDHPPPADEIRKWDRSRLFEFLDKEAGWGKRGRKAFWKARIPGDIFLDKEDWVFFNENFKLGLGPSETLAKLVKRINGTCQRTSAGNLPAKESIPVSEGFRELHQLLWRKEDVRDDIYTDEMFTPPTAQSDSNTYKPRKICKLSLAKLVKGTPSVRLPCQTNPLLVRECYVGALKMIKDREEMRQKRIMKEHKGIIDSTQAGRAMGEQAIVFCGHPGIGKTCFLSYVLVQRLLKGQPTIWQTDQHNHLLFDDHGVRNVTAADAPLDDATIWVLADQTAHGIANRWFVHEWLVIITSPPEWVNYKTAVKDHGELFYMPTWSWGEMTAILNVDDEVKLDRLYRAFRDFGPVPRMLLSFPWDSDAVELDKRIEDYESEIDQSITEMLEKRIVLDKHSLADSRLGDIRKLFMLVANESLMIKDYNISLNCDSTIVSPYVARRFASPIINWHEEVRRSLYNWLLTRGSTKIAAEWVFKLKAHEWLCRGEALKTKCLDTLQTLQINKRPGEKTFSNLADLRELVRDGADCTKVDRKILHTQIRPEHSNLDPVDSMCFRLFRDGEEVKLQTVVFLITVGETHPVKWSGLDDLWQTLPVEAKRVPPIIVFVVPEVTTGFTTRQPITGVEEEHEANSWNQYLLKLDLKKIWSDGGRVCSYIDGMNKDEEIFRSGSRKKRKTG